MTGKRNPVAEAVLLREHRQALDFTPAQIRAIERLLVVAQTGQTGGEAAVELLKGLEDEARRHPDMQRPFVPDWWRGVV